MPTSFVGWKMGSADSTFEPRTRVLAVVVAYERALNQVTCWRTLLDLLELRRGDGLHVAHVLIYDNSPVPLASPQPPRADVTYVHDAGNGGTAAAYARALELAPSVSADWLLLLDQDTALPVDHLTVAESARRADTAAMVPHVRHGDTLISPARITRFGSIRPLLPGERAADSRITAIASGALLKTSEVESVFPIPAGLWLDYVDHWLFARLGERRASIVVFDSRLDHDLSIRSPKAISARRLTSILEGESRFVSTLGPVARAAHPARLMLRALRLWRANPALAVHAVRWCARRLVSRVE
jgi:hypothetical protein